jgi:hypothetical protein
MSLSMYGHGLEQDLSHLRDMSGDSDGTITPGQVGMGTMRCRALSF